MIGNTFRQDRPLQALTCTRAAVESEGTVTIRLSPPGLVESRHGQYILDAEAARAIIEAFTAHGADLCIDYEHQSLGGEYSAPDGRAPAAGWVTSMYFDSERGLLGQVKWNPKGREVIRSGEYRYLSPVLLVRESDKRAIALHSCALTNCPAIPRMEALAASTRGQANADEPTAVNVPLDLMRQLRELLGLGREAKADEILQRAIEALSKEGDDEDEAESDKKLAQSVRATLGLPADAGADAVTLALSLHHQKQADAEVMSLRRQLAERDANDAVQVHILSGKINPNDEADVEECHRMALSDPQQFAHHMARRLPNPPPGRTTAPPRPTAGSRASVIANARREFQTDGPHQRLTSLRAFTALRLRENKLNPLTDDEVRTLQE